MRKLLKAFTVLLYNSQWRHFNIHLCIGKRNFVFIPLSLLILIHNKQLSESFWVETIQCSGWHDATFQSNFLRKASDVRLCIISGTTT
jgi:hypothetical protein